MRNKLFKRCRTCNEKKALMAYWDFELEGYLFLRDAAVCQTCLDRIRKQRLFSKKRMSDQTKKHNEWSMKNA